jgi:hypothetical protein
MHNFASWFLLIKLILISLEMTFAKWNQNFKNKKIIFYFNSGGCNAHSAFCQFYNYNLFSFFCVPPTQGIFPIHINGIMVRSIKLFWNKVLQSIWICFNNVKQIFRINMWSLDLKLINNIRHLITCVLPWAKVVIIADQNHQPN